MNIQTRLWIGGHEVPVERAEFNLGGLSVLPTIEQRMENIKRLQNNDPAALRALPERKGNP